MNSKIIINSLLLCLLLGLPGCSEDSANRHLRLGNWYVQKGLLEEAVLEFREVIRLISPHHQKITKEEFVMLGSAHYNLALVYTKKGWWDFALKEAEASFALQPTENHYELVQIIKQGEGFSKQTSE